MSDMIAYLRAYGGISLDEMPPNDIDFLIFAQLSYCDFLPVPAGATLCEAAQIMLHTEKSADDTEQRFSFQREDDEKLLLWAAAASRYCDVTVRAFERRYDAENMQFAALCLRAAGKDLVIFRGTTTRWPAGRRTLICASVCRWRRRRRRCAFVASGRRKASCL